MAVAGTSASLRRPLGGALAWIGARKAVIAAVLAPTLLYLILGYTHRWSSDDSFINLRVVDQLLHGNGPVFNAGERVEAYTSPLWLAILSVGSAVLGVARGATLAVGLGLLLSAGGLALACVGSLSLARDRARTWPLPL